MLESLTILAGQDKDGRPEAVSRVDLRPGEVLAVVGPTGSGKTQLISDIEQYAEGETPTRRTILINGRAAAEADTRHLVAEVSQKMNFVMDATVADFLMKHARVRGLDDPQQWVEQVLAVTNELAGEPVRGEHNLTVLSGGQARALMVGDVALISRAPVVLIDEIENAGIDRLRAMEILTGQGKIVLAVTHDVTLTLMAERRVVMQNGAMAQLHAITAAERTLRGQLMAMERDISRLRHDIRSGGRIETLENNEETQGLWQEFCCTARLTSVDPSCK